MRSLVLLLVISIFHLGKADDVFIDLPDGSIRGQSYQTQSGTKLYSFLQIPFAAPPVGDLRFQPPQPVRKWTGILDATQFNRVCYQSWLDSPQETEDCLLLNVFSPRLPSDNPEPLPVAIFIYGGSFIGGDANPGMYGPDYLVDHNIILVTLNYRMGPFGFISTGDTVIPGNMGLKDQHQAIRWTHDNIHLFGGDPDKITIWGQSAGSAAASYQLFYPPNEGLIRAGILESGTAINQFANHKDAKEFAFKTAAFIDASFQNSDDVEGLREFLLNVRATDLDQAGTQVNYWANGGGREWYQGICTYAPVIEADHEGAFVTQSMYDRLKSGNALRVPLLMGINSEEQLGEASNPSAMHDRFERFDNNLEWLTPDDMKIQDVERRRQVGQLIREMYVGDGQFVNNLGDGVRFDSDNTYTRAIIRYAELQSQFSDVFFYQFSYDGEVGGGDAVLEGAEHVQHGEEFRYIFKGGRNNDLNQVNQQDLTTMYRLLQMWTDFVIYLNPTPVPTEILQDVIWPTVGSSGQPGDVVYLDIDNDLTVRNHPKEATYGRWKALYDSLGYDDLETY